MWWTHDTSFRSGDILCELHQGVLEALRLSPAVRKNVLSNSFMSMTSERGFHQFLR